MAEEALRKARVGMETAQQRLRASEEYIQDMVFTQQASPNGAPFADTSNV